MSDAAFEIAARGMAAERSAMDDIAQKLAAGGAGPTGVDMSAVHDSTFIAASFSSVFDDALASADSLDVGAPLTDALQWASFSGNADSTPAFNAETQASRSAIQAEGDPIGQMIALVAAGRAYDADVAALQAAKQMDVEASDIDKL